MVDTGALARFVGFEVPERRPDGFDAFDHLLWAARVWHRCVQPCAAEVWQVFRIRRTANEKSLSRKRLLDLSQHFCPQMRIDFSVLQTLAHFLEALAAI